MSTASVTRDTVLAWMTSTGCGAAEAVDHFLPGASPEARRRLNDQIRQWRSRSARRATEPPPPSKPRRPQDDGGVAAADLPTPSTWCPDPTAAQGSHVSFLEAQVANLAGDVAWLRAHGRIDAAAKLTPQLCDLRKELESARIKAAGRVHLERSPAVVAAELERQRKLIELQAEKERRRAARAAADQAAASARGRAL